VLVVAAFAARILILFALMPPLEFFKLSQPISSAYKLAITWGGLRGALTLVLALAATENAALSPEVKRFIAVLATGLVLFTLFVNGTTLRLVIALLGLDRLSSRNQVLRDQVLALSYAEVCDSVHEMARDHELAESAVEQVIEPYQAWISAANARDAAERLSERDRLAIALAALATQERALVLEARADRIASPATVQVLLRNADALVEGARSEGRIGYRRAAERALSFPAAFRFAYSCYRYFRIVRFLDDRRSSPRSAMTSRNVVPLTNNVNSTRPVASTAIKRFTSGLSAAFSVAASASTKVSAPRSPPQVIASLYAELIGWLSLKNSSGGISANRIRMRAANAAPTRTATNIRSWSPTSPSSLGTRIEARIKTSERAQKAIWSHKSVRKDQL